MKACGEEAYLWELISAWNWINITKGCDDLNISVDWSEDPNHCPEIPDIVISNSSELINATADWHHIYIDDANTKYAFAKMRLEQDYISTYLENYTTWVIKLSWVAWQAAWWQPVWTWKNIDIDVARKCIKIKYRWIYIISFDGTVEIGSWIHAFRAMLTAWETDSERTPTILESRYSAPVWLPWRDTYQVQKKNFVTSVSGGGESSVSYNTAPETANEDMYPIWMIEPDISQDWWQWHEEWVWGSLWSYCSRFHVWWCVMAELNAWDLIQFWIKYSTQVSFKDINWQPWLPQEHAWRFAVLWLDSERSWWHDIWWEPGLTISATLIYPLDIYDN